MNRRKIYEYSLVHAVEYAYGSYLSGGQHPVTVVFLELDPELVDFNIHPAKREARFRDLSSLHQLVTGTLKEHLSSFAIPTHKHIKRYVVAAHVSLERHGLCIGS